jgi:hypothetical protein
MQDNQPITTILKANIKRALEKNVCDGCWKQHQLQGILMVLLKKCLYLSRS